MEKLKEIRRGQGICLKPLIGNREKRESLYTKQKRIESLEDKQSAPVGASQEKKYEKAKKTRYLLVNGTKG